MLQRAWYEGRGAAALLELSLLRQRAGCACARVDAHPRLRARAQSDTGVGRILMLRLLIFYPRFLLKTSPQVKRHQPSLLITPITSLFQLL